MAGGFSTGFSSGFDVLVEEPQPAPLDCDMWIDPQVLVDAAPEDKPLDPELAALAVQEATWVIDQLTNGFYHEAECWREVFEVRGCDLILSRTPIVSIDSVQRLHNCDQDSTDLNYCQTTAHKINLCSGDCYGSINNGGAWYQSNRMNGCRCPARVAVTYSIGSNLPPGAKAAVLMLSGEYVKASLGEKCSLPERISNIVRQGVSWTLVDPLDFLDKGMIGISRIDSWMSIARRSAPKSRAIDPLNHGVRVWSTRVGCGACVTP